MVFCYCSGVLLLFRLNVWRWVAILREFQTIMFYWPDGMLWKVRHPEVLFLEAGGQGLASAWHSMRGLWHDIKVIISPIPNVSFFCWEVLTFNWIIRGTILLRFQRTSSKNTIPSSSFKENELASQMKVWIWSEIFINLNFVQIDLTNNRKICIGVK